VAQTMLPNARLAQRTIGRIVGAAFDGDSREAVGECKTFAITVCTLFCVTMNMVCETYEIQKNDAARTHEILRQRETSPAPSSSS